MITRAGLGLCGCCGAGSDLSFPSTLPFSFLYLSTMKKRKEREYPPAIPASMYPVT